MGTSIAGRGSVDPLNALPDKAAQQARARLRTPEADEPVRDPATHRLMYPPRERVPIVVQRHGRPGGSADVGPHPEDDAQAFVDAIRGSSIVRLVTDEREAVILVEIFDPGSTSEQTDLEAIGGRANPELRFTVRVNAVNPSTESVENRLSFRMTLGRGRAAENLVDHIERWAIRNHGQLRQMMADADAPSPTEPGPSDAG